MISFRVREWLGKLLLTLLGLFVGLIISEISLVWLVPPPIRWYYPQPLHSPDPELGWVMKPNQRSFTHDKVVSTNAIGLRSAEISPKKAATVLRILSLGDSQAFGNGVAQESTYAARLESLLRSRLPGRGVEVINAGVQGYDTVQEVILLERLLPSIKPDIVTLGFYLNDIVEVEQPKNRFAIDAATGEFKLTGFFTRFIPYRLIYLLKRSRLVTFVYWKYLIRRMDAQGNITTDILLGRSAQKLDTPWAIIEKNLIRAQSLAKVHHFRLIVFPVPASHEFLRDYPHEEYRSRFMALTKKLGLDDFDPTREMKVMGGGYDKYFVQWDGHINPTTHNLIAELLAEKVQTEKGGL